MIPGILAASSMKLSKVVSSTVPGSGELKSAFIVIIFSPQIEIIMEKGLSLVNGFNRTGF